MSKSCIKPAMAMLISLCLACNDSDRSPIPSTRVNFAIDLNFQDADLNSPLATKSFIAPRIGNDESGFGFGGVLVINGINPNGGLLNLFAYDLACPVEVSPKVTVVPDDIGKATCSKCGAVFNIATGTGMPEKGSKHPLRSYSVQLERDKRYIVRN